MIHQIILAITVLILFFIIFFTLFLLRRKSAKRKRLNREPFHNDWHKYLCDNVEIYNHLPTDIRKKLQDKVKIFVAEKNFEGCGGLELTPLHKVIIAAMACLPIVNGDDNLYPYLRNIIIYPEVYQNKNRSSAGTNIVTETPHYVSGESWGTGTLILAWNICLKDCQHYGTGSNVIIHEFTHQLDSENGPTDGIPAIYNEELLIEWEKLFRKEFLSFRTNTHHKYDVIDDYGAVNAAEFYAVCAETFFELPRQLQKQHPAIYKEFKKFYNLDPASWQK